MFDMNMQSASQSVIKNFASNLDSGKNCLQNMSSLQLLYNNSYYFTNSNINLPKICSNVNQRKKTIKRLRFSPQEDKLLLSIISSIGTNDWNKVSDELFKQSQNVYQRSPRQCKDRYINYLSPDINNKEWTYEEDQCLVINCLLHPYQWRLIKKFLPGRSEISLKNRFKRIEKEGMNFLRPIINQISQNPKYSYLFLKNSNISQLQNNLDKFKSSKENTIKSILNDTEKLFQDYKIKYNANKTFKFNDNKVDHSDDIFVQQNFEDEFLKINSDFESFDFQDTFEMFDE